MAGGTAWEVLERLRLDRGAWLLVLGASGSVGSYLLQLAALRGIATVAVGRREHHDRLRRLGAAPCFRWRRQRGRTAFWKAAMPAARSYSSPN